MATRTSFLLPAEEPWREVVIGPLVLAPPGTRPGGTPTPELFRALEAPGYVKATMNFLVEDRGDTCVLTTETRVHATDPSARRRFGAYWRVIYPGSALITVTNFARPGIEIEIQAVGVIGDRCSTENPCSAEGQARKK